MFSKIFDKNAIIVPIKYLSHAQKNVAYAINPNKFWFKLSEGSGSFLPELRFKRNELLFHRKRMHV
jgi:hypothetical protein